MKIPDGLEVQNKNLALKLKKVIYGLKQSGRYWNEKFDQFIKSRGFTQSNADKCIYTGVFEKEKVYLALYVDDGLVLAKSIKVLNKILNLLKDKFSITISELGNFVGMEITKTERNIFLTNVCTLTSF